MKFKIHFHFDKDGQYLEDTVVISGATLEDVQDRVEQWFASRGMTVDENYDWSEEIR